MPTVTARALPARRGVSSMSVTINRRKPFAVNRRGLSRGKTKSRVQQRFLFWKLGGVARKYTTKGRYRHLPERVAPKAAR
jgi:hypothetical protein